MNNVKKIAVSLLILGVMTGFTQAATHHRIQARRNVAAERGLCPWNWC